MTVLDHRLTWFRSLRFHDQTNALERRLQAVNCLRQPPAVVHGAQVRLAVSLHRHAVADDEVAAVQRAHVDGGSVALTQAAHELHAGAEAAAVGQNADGPGGGGGGGGWRLTKRPRRHRGGGSRYLGKPQVGFRTDYLGFICF